MFVCVGSQLSTLILDQSLKTSGLHCSTLLWEKEVRQDIEAFILQVPNTLCKAKGFTAVILARSISLITDLLIHVLWSCQRTEAFVSAQKESACRF